MIQHLGKYLIVTTFCLFVTIYCGARNMEKVPPATGDQAPLFESKDSEGSTWKLSDQLGNKYLVIYFFPAAMTGG